MKTEQVKRRLFLGQLLAFLLLPWHRRKVSRFSVHNILPAEDLILRGLTKPVTIAASGYVQPNIEREEELCAQSMCQRPFVTHYGGGRALIIKS